jgi:hypothetical protein
MGKRTHLAPGLMPGLMLGPALGLVLGLAGCGSTHPAAPASPSSSPVTPVGTSPTTDPTANPPVMPEVARQHTKAGAKAFVTYYVDLITYAETTLKTDAVRQLSMPTCSGCLGGIHGLRKIARQGGQITGAGLSVSNLRSEAIDDHGVVTLAFDLANTAERISIPGKPTVLHPAGKHPMIMTLVARPNGWVVGEYREQRP